ncbi:hypothetical protein AAL_03059 [Moelleriella libera RCEF 2490]|uniref:Uncharacterized protein n=1 Tax=Moelleriella libera RCEF 2490 TaxID=1081109 RepID=A0A168E8T3_9HYPO|nr:hypothetical protein AAL_03059 [Moelleriella libera RCEF 2490]
MARRDEAPADNKTGVGGNGGAAAAAAAAVAVPASSSLGPAVLPNVNGKGGGGGGSGSSARRHGKTKKRAKGVAWADDDNKELRRQQRRAQDQLTFYRESTPPPLDGAAIDRQNDSSIAQTYDYSYDRVAPPAPIPQATVCGLRRRLFCALLLAVVVVVVVAVGVGVGVGVGVKQTSRKTMPATSSPDSTSSTPSVNSSPPAQTSTAACPAANGTTYHVPGAGKTFLRLCGTDFSGDDGAVDLGVVWTATVQDCINSCAGYPNCTGCGWGVMTGDPGTDHRCWLKSDLQKSHAVRSGWDFAILQ